VFGHGHGESVMSERLPRDNMYRRKQAQADAGSRKTAAQLLESSGDSEGFSEITSRTSGLGVSAGAA